MLGKTYNWAGAYMIRSKYLWNVYPNRKMLVSRYGQNLQILAVVAYKNKSGFIDRPLMQYIANNFSFTTKDKSFERELELYNNFEQIRIDILDYLHVNDIKLRKKIKLFYLHIRLNLCVNFHREDTFMIYYDLLKTEGGLLIEDHLSKAIFEHNKMKQFYFSFLLKMRNLFE